MKHYQFDRDHEPEEVPEKPEAEYSPEDQHESDQEYARELFKSAIRHQFDNTDEFQCYTLHRLIRIARQVGFVDLADEMKSDMKGNCK